MQTSARFHFQACAKSLIFKGNNNEILEKEKKKKYNFERHSEEGIWQI